jgi:hypothetical protein
MIMQFLDALAYLKDTLKTFALIHFIVLAKIQYIPGFIINLP